MIDLVNRQVKNKLIKIEEEIWVLSQTVHSHFTGEATCNNNENLHYSFKGNIYSSIRVVLILASADVYFIFHY